MKSKGLYFRLSAKGLLVVFSLLISIVLLSATSTAENTFNVNDYSEDELINIMITIQQADTKLVPCNI